MQTSHSQNAKKPVQNNPDPNAVSAAAAPGYARKLVSSPRRQPRQTNGRSGIFSHRVCAYDTKRNPWMMGDSDRTSEIGIGVVGQTIRPREGICRPISNITRAKSTNDSRCHSSGGPFPTHALALHKEVTNQDTRYRAPLA